MILRREFESYEAYVHAQGGKARGRGADLLASRPAQVRGFSSLLREAVRFLPAGPVLCLGARTGAEMDAFEGLGFIEAVGIDLHPLGKDVRVGDWHAMPELADGSFGIVYSNSFDHCLYLDKACAEIARLLKPGGCFYLMASDKGDKSSSAEVEKWKASQKHTEALFCSRARPAACAVSRSASRLGKRTRTSQFGWMASCGRSARSTSVGVPTARQRHCRS